MRPSTRRLDVAAPETWDLVDMARRTPTARGRRLRLVPTWDGPFDAGGSERLAFDGAGGGALRAEVADRGGDQLAGVVAGGRAGRGHHTRRRGADGRKPARPAWPAATPASWQPRRPPCRSWPGPSRPTLPAGASRKPPARRYPQRPFPRSMHDRFCGVDRGASCPAGRFLARPIARIQGPGSAVARLELAPVPVAAEAEALQPCVIDTSYEPSPAATGQRCLEHEAASARAASRSCRWSSVAAARERIGDTTSPGSQVKNTRARVNRPAITSAMGPRAARCTPRPGNHPRSRQRAIPCRSSRSPLSAGQVSPPVAAGLGDGEQATGQRRPSATSR